MSTQTHNTHDTAPSAVAPAPGSPPPAGEATPPRWAGWHHDAQGNWRLLVQDAATTREAWFGLFTQRPFEVGVYVVLPAGTHPIQCPPETPATKNAGRGRMRSCHIHDHPGARDG